MVEIGYFDLNMGGNQKWAALNDRAIEVDAINYEGVVRIYNTYIEVTYLPVEFHVGENVTALLWGVVEGGGVIENPALVIESLLKTFLEFTDAEVDAASFAEAEAALSSIDFGFVLRNSRDSWQTLSELAMQARCYLFAEASGYKLVRRPTFLGDADRAISDSGVTGFIAGTNKLVSMGTAEIYNLISVKYGEDYRLTSDPFQNIATAEDAVSQEAYGEKELEIEAWAIQYNAEAQNLADYLLAQQKDPRYLYKFQSYIANYDVERGDVLAITDAKWGLSSAKGQVVAIRFQPGSANDKIPHTIEFTVLLEPYRWAWSESGNPQWDPGEAGLLFSGNSGILALTPSGGTLTPMMRFDSSDSSSNARIHITGRVRMRETLANATDNPLDWDDTNKRILFALNDNTTVMALEAATGDLLVAERTIDQQTIAHAGGANEIASDAANLWFNANNVRILETDAAGWASVATVIVENAAQAAIF